MADVAWQTYKTLCNHPNVLSRTLLEWTVTHVHVPALAARLMEVLSGRPIDRPADHRAPPSTDMFYANLEVADVQGVLHALAVVPDRDTRRFRHATAVWNDYLLLLQQQEDQHMNAQDQVTKLMRAFDNRDIEGIAACFAPDAVYHNIPMEAVQGVDAIRGSLAPFMGMASEIRFEVLRSAANGNVVMNERIDRFKMGDKWLAIAVMGVFEVGDQGITAWRDYFDLGQFQSQMAAIQAG